MILPRESGHCDSMSSWWNMKVLTLDGFLTPKWDNGQSVEWVAWECSACTWNNTLLDFWMYKNPWILWFLEFSMYCYQVGQWINCPLSLSDFQLSDWNVFIPCFTFNLLFLRCTASMWNSALLEVSNVHLVARHRESGLWKLEIRHHKITKSTKASHHRLHNEGRK